MQTIQQQSTDHASGPEAIASDVDNPADLVDETDVDDVEDETQRTNDNPSDAESQ